jgi:hypothetical protein
MSLGFVLLRRLTWLLPPAVRILRGMKVYIMGFDETPEYNEAKKSGKPYFG